MLPFGVEKLRSSAFHVLKLYFFSRAARLELDRNEITGTLPEEYGRLTKLVSLDFTRCDLIGTIPTELGNLGDLGTRIVIEASLFLKTILLLREFLHDRRSSLFLLGTAYSHSWSWPQRFRWKDTH